MSVKQFAALAAAFVFQFLFFLLPVQFFVECYSAGGGTADFFDFAVGFFDGLFEVLFEVVCPVVQFLCFLVDVCEVLLFEGGEQCCAAAVKVVVQGGVLPGGGRSVVVAAAGGDFQQFFGVVFDERGAVRGAGGDEQVLFALAEGGDVEQAGGEVAALSAPGFEAADFVAVGSVVEGEARRWAGALFGLFEYPLGERVREAVGAAVFVARAVLRQGVAAKRDAAVFEVGGQVVQGEAVCVVFGMGAEFAGGELHQGAFAGAARVLCGDAEFFLYAFVEVFQHGAAGVEHGLVDFISQFLLQGGEGGFDVGRQAAVAVDISDAAFDVHAAANGAQDFVAGTEDAAEELEFLVEQFVNAGVGFVAAVNEVDDDDIVFLSVAVAAAYALLDALRIPRQVVVDDERAELQVDAFGTRFGGNHDGAVLFEVFDEGGAGVGSFGTGDFVAAFVVFEPVFVDFLCLGVAVAAVEEDDAVAVFACVGGVRQGFLQVVLGAAGFGEDDGFARRAQFVEFCEGLFQRFQQGAAFFVFADVFGEFAVAPEFVGFAGDGLVFGRGEADAVVIGVSPFFGGFIEVFVVFVQCSSKVGFGGFGKFALQARLHGAQCPGNGAAG